MLSSLCTMRHVEKGGGFCALGTYLKPRLGLDPRFINEKIPIHSQWAFDASGLLLVSLFWQVS